MSSTNKTTNYNLPQFIASDKPTWLGDVNGAMNAIDTALKSIENSVTLLDSNVGTDHDLLTEVKSSVDEINRSLTTINNSVSANTTNISALDGDISYFQSTITSINTRLSLLTTKLEAIEGLNLNTVLNKMKNTRVILAEVTAVASSESFDSGEKKSVIMSATVPADLDTITKDDIIPSMFIGSGITIAGTPNIAIASASSSSIKTILVTVDLRNARSNAVTATCSLRLLITKQI